MDQALLRYAVDFLQHEILSKEPIVFRKNGHIRKAVCIEKGGMCVGSVTRRTVKTQQSPWLSGPIIMENRVRVYGGTVADSAKVGV